MRTAIRTRRKPKTLDRDLEVYRRHAEMCQVFTSPIRLKILSLLREEEVSVSNLAHRLGVTVGNLSQHLNMMKQRRVLAPRKDGNNVYYRVANPRMLKAFDLMREILREQMQEESLLAQHLARVQVQW